MNIAIAPEEFWDESRVAVLRTAVDNAEAQLVEVSEAEALVWLDPGDASSLERLLTANPSIGWVQLPWAGVEHFANACLFDGPQSFTCAKGSYGEQVGEHALVLIHSCLRQLTKQARTKGWNQIQPVSLFDKRVTIVGAGGIASTLIALLQPYRCDITVVRRSADTVEGAERTVSIAELDDVLPNTDVLVLALALTPATEGLIGAEQLELLPSSAVLVNVARGGHVDQPALVQTLRAGRLAACGLDVATPEPLPEDHPFWQMDNVTITSHSADGHEFVTSQLALRLTKNIKLRQAGLPLDGLVDPVNGY